MLKEACSWLSALREPITVVISRKSTNSGATEPLVSLTTLSVTSVRGGSRSPIQKDGKVPAARGKNTCALLDEAKADGIADAPPGDIDSRHLSRSFVLLRSPLSNDVVITNEVGEVRRFGRGDGYTILILTGVAVILL